MSQGKVFFELNRFPLTLLVTAVMQLIAIERATAQTLTRSTVETHIRAILAAYTAHDVETIARLDPPSPGFGFRVLQARLPDRPYMDALNAFFSNHDYYRIELNELQTEIDGDLAL